MFQLKEPVRSSSPIPQFYRWSSEVVGNLPKITKLVQQNQRRFGVPKSPLLCSFLSTKQSNYLAFKV